MKTRLHLKPGQKGTRKLVAHYGERLLCVRYRYDETARKRYKTVELIVEEVDWTPPPKKYKPNDTVTVRIAWDEYELQKLAREAGGRWNRERQLWHILYANVEGTRLEKRIVSDAGENAREKSKASG